MECSTLDRPGRRVKDVNLETCNVSNEILTCVIPSWIKSSKCVVRVIVSTLGGHYDLLNRWNVGTVIGNNVNVNEVLP